MMLLARAAFFKHLAMGLTIGLTFACALAFLCAPQLASKVQKASVTKEEVERYLEYDLRHGAKYVETTNDADMEEDDW